MGVGLFFNDTATTEIYTLSLHDALPISGIALPAASLIKSRSGPVWWSVLLKYLSADPENVFLGSLGIFISSLIWFPGIRVWDLAFEKLGTGSGQGSPESRGVRHFDTSIPEHPDTPLPPYSHICPVRVVTARSVEFNEGAVAKTPPLLPYKFFTTASVSM